MANQGPGNGGQRIEPVIGGISAAEGDGGRRFPGASPKRGSRGLLVALALVAVAAAGGAYWYFRQTPPAPVVAAPPPPPPAKVEPAIRHPIGEAAPQAPLPPLARSDVEVVDGLAALVGRDPITRYVVLPDIIRRIVVAVDNLPRETLARRLSPLKAVPGAFAVTKSGSREVIAAANSARYSPYVRVLEGVDSQKLVALYVRFYPLFQEAYRELGYPKGYFNDRLVEVLDMMIAAPEPAGPIELVQEKVMYEFADSSLESLPVGQKMLLRMGTENAKKVKAKLREIRALVADRGNVGIR